MNVSSVKNLNGETFSAVQDADLTTVVQTNSGEWDRISALSGYSAEGWQVKLGKGNNDPKIIASPTTITANGIAPFTGHLTVSSYPNWVSISNGSIYLRNQNRSDSAQIIRPNNIVNWNNTTSVLQTNSSNWNDISAYQNASSTYLTALNIPESADWEDTTDVVQTNSAAWGAGSTPTYDYTDGLISAIDTSGLFAQGLLSGSKIGRNISWYGGAGILNSAQMWLNPDQAHFAITSGIYGPLQYATGATITYGSSGSPAPNNGQIFGGFFKGNEWYVSNATAGQALRGETHNSRGVHLSGATTAGLGFDLSVSAVSGKNDTANNYNWKLERGCVSGKGINGEWRYGPAEDTALRTASAWDETISSYQNASSTYLTAVDLSPYATTAEVDTLSSMFSGAIDYVSANAGGGGSTSGLVSGTNFIEVPDWEGSTEGEYWSACISGDVKVAHGYYIEETEFHQDEVYSLSAIGSDIGNKLNKNTIENSKTIRSFNNVFEVSDIAYKRNNFTNGSAHRIDLDDDAEISYIADDVVDNSNLYSASITAETTATGSINSDGGIWRLVDFSNGSALLTALYPAGIRDDHIGLYIWDDWGYITNCEATCTVYTSAELAPLAYKDDIPKINFVSTSSEATGTNILYVVTGTGA